MERSRGKATERTGTGISPGPTSKAANIAKPYYPIINRYYQKKLAQTNEAVAIKAISNKLARASYDILRDQVAYDEKKLFGGRAEPVAGLVNNREGLIGRLSRFQKLSHGAHSWPNPICPRHSTPDEGWLQPQVLRRTFGHGTAPTIFWVACDTRSYKDLESRWVTGTDQR